MTTMAGTCPYITTKFGDRCNIDTGGKLLCELHEDVVLEVLNSVNDELVAKLRLSPRDKRNTCPLSA